MMSSFNDKAATMQSISYTLSKTTFQLTIVFFLVSCLSGCRYWELYRFSEQFCEFDNYIELSAPESGLNIAFNTPTLKRSLLLRYLGSLPVTTDINKQSAEKASIDSFIIASKDTGSQKEFSFQLDYHVLNDTPLLKNASLDARLSKLFSPELVRPILLSFCTDDYDIERKQVELWFRLNDIVRETLPTIPKTLSVFGAPVSQISDAQSQASSLSYRFAFLSKQGKAIEDNFQAKDINFTFTFDAEQILRTLHIRYYRYDYLIDFVASEGRLVVTRSAQ
jgi:hypothetical protein